MIEITKELLDDLETKAKAATREFGEWKWRECCKDSNCGLATVYIEPDGLIGYNIPINDAKFIVAANPVVILNLIEYIRQLEKIAGM